MNELFEAAKQGNVPEIRRILSAKDTNKVDVNMPNEKRGGCTALHYGTPCPGTTLVNHQCGSDLFSWSTCMRFFLYSPMIFFSCRFRRRNVYYTHGFTRLSADYVWLAYYVAFSSACTPAVWYEAACLVAFKDFFSNCNRIYHR
jgi:hypothetical protein